MGRRAAAGEQGAACRRGPEEERKGDAGGEDVPAGMVLQ